ncbi:MAG: HAD-IA family hydrolase [Clostridia bacterium]|nr:HAD-IA family hydrolase [Clostridia bacterium]
MNYKSFLPNLQGAIFDFDGTLFDSMYLWDNVANDSLIALGIEPPKDYRRKLRNMSVYQAAIYTVERFNLHITPEEYVDIINKIIEKYYSCEVVPKEGIPDFLKNLKDNGVKICIATATDRHHIENALNRCGLRHYISEIFTCTMVGAGKDNPKIFETALAFLGTDKEMTLVFEDSLYALKTAKNAGFKTAGVFDCSEKNQRELKCTADFYINSFK